jgi:hypothetical protein
MRKPKRKIAPESAQTIETRAPQNQKLKSTTGQKIDGERSSKQARVIEMLRSPAGATISAVMKATGWQQHSVRGFFAGTVRKRLRLKLSSKELDGTRVYRVSGGARVRPSSDQPSRNKP